MECLITGAVLTEIADKLRSVYGTSQKYTLSDMASAISGITFQESPRLIERSSSIYMNNVISYVASYAFYSHISLTEVSFGNVGIVYTSAFDNCTSLASVSLPKAQAIYENAFSGCTSLSSIDFPVASTVGASAFMGCTNLQTVHLHEANTVGSSAFVNCSKLQTATFNNVSTIHTSAFANCQKLASLYLLGSTVATITNSSVFLSTPIRNSSYLSGSYGSIFVPESLVSAYKAAAGWSTISARITAYVPSE